MTVIFTWRHLVLAASPNTDIAGENMMWRDPARSKASALNPYFIYKYLQACAVGDWFEQ